MVICTATVNLDTRCQQEEAQEQTDGEAQQLPSTWVYFLALCCLFQTGTNQNRLSRVFKNLNYINYYLCVAAGTTVRGQLVEVSFLLPPCRFRANSTATAFTR